MVRLRLFGAVLYYLAFIYGIQELLQWIDPAIYDSSNGRSFAAFTGVLSLLVFGIVSEVFDKKQGLRSDFFDILLGDDDAR